MPVVGHALGHDDFQGVVAEVHPGVVRQLIELAPVGIDEPVSPEGLEGPAGIDPVHVGGGVAVADVAIDVGHVQRQLPLELPAVAGHELVGERLMQARIELVVGDFAGARRRRHDRLEDTVQVHVVLIPPPDAGGGAEARHRVAAVHLLVHPGQAGAHHVPGVLGHGPGEAHPRPDLRAAHPGDAVDGVEAIHEIHPQAGGDVEAVGGAPGVLEVESDVPVPGLAALDLRRVVDSPVERQVSAPGVVRVDEVVVFLVVAPVQVFRVARAAVPRRREDSRLDLVTSPVKREIRADDDHGGGIFAVGRAVSDLQDPAASLQDAGRRERLLVDGDLRPRQPQLFDGGDGGLRALVVIGHADIGGQGRAPHRGHFSAEEVAAGLVEVVVDRVVLAGAREVGDVELVIAGEIVVRAELRRQLGVRPVTFEDVGEKVGPGSELFENLDLAAGTADLGGVPRQPAGMEEPHLVPGDGPADGVIELLHLLERRGPRR